MKFIDSTKAVTQYFLEKSFRKSYIYKSRIRKKKQNGWMSVCVHVFCAVLCVCFCTGLFVKHMTSDYHPTISIGSLCRWHSQHVIIVWIFEPFCYFQSFINFSFDIHSRHHVVVWLMFIYVLELAYTVHAYVLQDMDYFNCALNECLFFPLKTL